MNMAQQAFDLGLGTTYERFALNAWLAQLIGKYDFRTVLEGPGDGMTGIPGLNSLIFGRQGVEVALVLGDATAVELARRGWRSQGCLGRARFLCSPDGRIPVRANQFDLVWNFNRLPFFDPRALIAEMARVSRRYVLLFVPSRHSYGFLARRLHHRLTRQSWPYGNTDVMELGKIVDLLSELDLRVLETVLLDAPWWPDIIDVSEFITDLFPFLSRLLPERCPESAEGRGPSAYRWDSEHLPYFDPETYTEVHQRIRRLFFIERSRVHWFKRIFAHHFGVLAVKQGTTDD